MKIATSALSMDASRGHRDVKEIYSTETATVSGNNESEKFKLNLPEMRMGGGYSEESRQVFEFQARSTVSTKNSQVNWSLESAKTLETVIGSVIGNQVQLQNNAAKGQDQQQPESDRKLPLPASRMSFVSHSVKYQYEQVAVSSSGTVTTEDGRRIDFSLQLSMEREMINRSSIAVQTSNGFLIDPLVLQFDSDSQLVSGVPFSFDLDGDGCNEKISGLKSGCGFLAIDHNNDNIINNGCELFGPASGYGFSELAMLDSDHNSWIDENDPVFDKLMVWMGASEGEQRLLSLKEAGVGALSLTNVESLFQLQGDDHSVLGQVATSGIFITEAGQVRSLQEIDLAIDPGKKRQLDDDQPLTTGEQSMLALRSLLAMRRRQAEVLAGRQREIYAQRSRPDLFARIFEHWGEDDRDLRWKMV